MNRKNINFEGKEEQEDYYKGLTAKIILDAKILHGFDFDDLSDLSLKMSSLHTHGNNDKGIKRLLEGDKKFSWVPETIEGFRKFRAENKRWSSNLLDKNNQAEVQHFLEVFAETFEQEYLIYLEDKERGTGRVK